MKNKIVVGLVLASLVSANAFAAAGATSGVVKAELGKYLDTKVKPYVFGNSSSSAKGLAAQASKIANDKLMNRLDVRAEDRANIQSALSLNTADARSKEVVEKRLENLAALTGAKELSESMITKKQHVEEAQSILGASKALTKTIANSVYTRAKTNSSTLSKDELNDASLALDKMEALPESIVKMDRSERDMYTAVENRRDELLISGKFSGEEALVQAIMDVKKVDKSKAIEIVRKLKDCV